MGRARRLPIAALALIALSALVLGLIVGAGFEDRRDGRAAELEPGRPFLASLVPPPAARPERGEPALPPDELTRALPLEQKVAQLFVLGFEGTDLNADVFVRLRELGLGGIVVRDANYTGSDLLGQLAGEAAVIADQEGHVRPWVLASQPGGELNSFTDLPPATAPADLASAREAGAAASESATALRGLGLTGVLGPALDVGFEGGSALGVATYSDDAAEVVGFAEATVTAYRDAGMFAAVEHFPGLGAADQSTDDGPASVGLGLAELRRRDLQPFRAAIETGVPGVVLSHALYPINDFTAPASLSREVVTGVLRGELGFRGIAITDDLTAPAVTVAASVPDAAVEALRAGADMVYVSGDAAGQAAAYRAVLRAAERGRLSRARIDEAVTRILQVKRDYGLVS